MPIIVSNPMIRRRKLDEFIWSGVLKNSDGKPVQYFYRRDYSLPKSEFLKNINKIMYMYNNSHPKNIATEYSYTIIKGRFKHEKPRYVK